MQKCMSATAFSQAAVSWQLYHGCIAQLPWFLVHVGCMTRRPGSLPLPAVPAFSHVDGAFLGALDGLHGVR
jgi:hypothetical protein